MIWDFPTIRSKTIDAEVTPNYIHRITIVTRRPWIRIIWGPPQKTIMFGKYRLNFTSEPDAAEHMTAVDKAAGEDRG